MWTTDLEWFNPHNFHNRPWQNSHRNGSMEHQFNLRRSMTHTSWEQSSTSMLEPSHPFPQLNPGSSDQHPAQAPPKLYFNPSAPGLTSYVSVPIPRHTFHTICPSSKPHMSRQASPPNRPSPSSKQFFKNMVSKHPSTL